MSAAEPPPGAPSGVRAWRLLGVFWAVLLVALATGAATLAWLGPPPAVAPPRPLARLAPAAPNVIPAGPLPPLARPGSAGPTIPPPAAAPSPAAAGGPIPAPVPALEEASAAYPGDFLPRIGADRRSPMQVYAAFADPAEGRPRVAILLAGVGMSASESEEAIDTLPAAVSLAVSPYADRPDALLARARARGHETLVSIPMEPSGYPLDDPGPHALMTGNSEAENRKRLDWALSRFGGYAGATGALGPGLLGERFAASAPQMQLVLAELAARGLLYIDPRPGAPRPQPAVGRSVDVVIDEPAVRTEIVANLARLEQLAHDRGSAIGLAVAPRPVTIDRLAAWANTLGTRGIALVPVSAVAPVVAPSAPAADTAAAAGSVP